MSDRACEACAYETAPAWAEAWRCACAGCGGRHLVCVDCGLRWGRQILPGGPEKPWTELDACPAESVVAGAVMGGSPRHNVSRVVWDILQEFIGDPIDDETQANVLKAVLAADLPVTHVLTALQRKDIGLQFADGREVWLRLGLMSP